MLYFIEFVMTEEKAMAGKKIKHSVLDMSHLRYPWVIL